MRLFASAEAGDLEATADTVVLEDGDRGSAEGVALTVRQEPTLTVEADHTRWDMARRVAVFQGDVQAHRGSFRMTCDRIEVHYDAVGQVRSGLASGRVVVGRDAWTARSASAELTLPDGKVVLVGDPVISDGVNLMSGRRITVLLDDEAVDCEDCVLEIDAGRLESP